MMTVISLILLALVVLFVAYPPAAVWANERARAGVAYLRERWKSEGPKA